MKVNWYRAGDSAEPMVVLDGVQHRQRPKAVVAVITSPQHNWRRNFAIGYSGAGKSTGPPHYNGLSHHQRHLTVGGAEISGKRLRTARLRNIGMIFHQFNLIELSRTVLGSVGSPEDCRRWSRRTAAPAPWKCSSLWVLADRVRATTGSFRAVRISVGIARYRDQPAPARRMSPPARWTRNHSPSARSAPSV